MQLEFIENNDSKQYPCFGSTYDIINKTNSILIWTICLNWNVLEYIEVNEKLKWHGYEIVKALLQQKKKLSVWHPTMKNKWFWLSVVRKLKKEWVLSSVKFKEAMKVYDKQDRLKFIYSLIDKLKQQKEFTKKEFRKINYDLQYIVFSWFSSKEKLIEELKNYFETIWISDIEISENEINFMYNFWANHAFNSIELIPN